MFTPLPLEGLVYLAKTTWPIATVFRLYLENLNWVPNAETASGPTPKGAPTFEEFQRGVLALQRLQDRGEIVFGAEERREAQGSPLPAASVTARDLVEAAKSGYEYRLDEPGTKWTLVKKTQRPILFVDPRAVDSPEWKATFSRSARRCRGETTRTSSSSRYSSERSSGKETGGPTKPRSEEAASTCRSTCSLLVMERLISIPG